MYGCRWWSNLFRRIMLAATMIASLMVLSGCIDQLLRERADTRPLPAVRTAPAAPLGDSQGTEDITVTLYLPDWNRDRLVNTPDTVTVYTGADIVQPVTEQLLSRLSAAFPNLGGSELRLAGDAASVERSGELVFVNLSGAALRLDSSEQSVVRMALTQTLTELDGVNYVGVLVNGLEPGIDLGMNIPYGLSRRLFNEDIELYLNGLDTVSGVEAGGLSRDAALYFASTDGERILPEPRTVNVSGGDIGELRQRMIAAILSELSRGSAIRPEHTETLMPLEYLIGEPRVITPSGGADTLLQLSFRSELNDYLTIHGGSQYLLFATLTQTLTRFVPGLDGLIIQIGGETVTELLTPNRTIIPLTNRRMTRDDFAGSAADLCSLYIPRMDGLGLMAVECAVEQSVAESPRALISLLLSASQRYDRMIGRVRLAPPLPARDGTPAAFTEADLLGISIESGAALVNFSGNVASACEELTSEQARDFIFSVVNTLTSLRGVNKVRFYFEGSPRELFPHLQQNAVGVSGEADTSAMLRGEGAGVSSLGEFYRQPGLIMTETVNLIETE